LTAVKNKLESERHVVSQVAESQIGRVVSGARLGENLMAKAVQKVALSPSRDISFDKLVVSQPNARHIKARFSVGGLAEDIRPMLDVRDVETGMVEIPAGDHRFYRMEIMPDLFGDWADTEVAVKAARFDIPVEGEAGIQIVRQGRVEVASHSSYNGYY